MLPQNSPWFIVVKVQTTQNFIRYKHTDTLAALQELIEIVAKLRSPDGGCPWYLAQTAETLTPYVIEEAYEVVDAIKSGDKSAIAGYFLVAK